MRVNVMSGPKVSAVPSVVGMSIADAQTALHNAGFNGNPTYVNNSDAPQGQVISQNPAGGTSEPQGTTINLSVSNGPPQVTVPDVVGYTSQQAVSTLEAAGFKVQQQYTSTDPSQDEHRPDAESGGQFPGGGAFDGRDHDRPALAGAPPPPTTTTTP